MRNVYDVRYSNDETYWGNSPSHLCFRVLELMPPDRPLKLLDVGCGEGQNALFFARNGYQVTAFDSSRVGIEKTSQVAANIGVTMTTFLADINSHRLTESFDIIFSSGTLHYATPEKREEIIKNYQDFTVENGLNTISLFVKKPFLYSAPDDRNPGRYLWDSGELMMYYRNWKIDLISEGITDCMSGGVPHQHARNLIIATKPDFKQPAGTDGERTTAQL